jgi:hypothetical protein
VKTQIWIAVSVYILVAIVRKLLRPEASLHTLLQAISVALFKRVDIQSAISGTPYRSEGRNIPQSIGSIHILTGQQ